MYLASLLVVFAIEQEDQARFSQIDRSETIPGGHLNNSETVNDILKAFGRSLHMMLLRESKAVMAGNQSQAPNVTSNELSSSLPASGYSGQLEPVREQALFSLLKDLAAAYRDTFKQDYGITKEVYVIPIGRLIIGGNHLSDQIEQKIEIRRGVSHSLQAGAPSILPSGSNHPGSTSVFRVPLGGCLEKDLAVEIMEFSEHSVGCAFSITGLAVVRVQAWHQHKISPERIAVNQKVKARFTQILISEAIPGGHLNDSETVDDILKAIGKSYPLLSQDVLLLLLRGSNAVVAGNLSQQANVTSNELSSSLPASGPFGELDPVEEQFLYSFLKNLAAAYRDTFKQDYGISKEIYVIPVGKLGDFGSRFPSRKFVIGVLHKMDGRLSGIAALLVDIHLFG
uniref:Uncharacterized protein n=1 Tax=Ditylenchus dipsaci TaxID=166011 RepID=A0A915DZ53_9BILA